MGKPEHQAVVTNPPEAEYPQGVALPLLCFALWCAGMAMALVLVPLAKAGELAWRLKRSLLVFVLATTVAHALILPGDDDSHTNTPPGSLASPWSCVGYWQGCAGTTISPHHFIAATHIGGYVGDWFTLNGQRYLVMGGEHDPFSDLSVWLVLGTFPHFVNLNAEARLTATNALVMGAGLTRGAKVFAEFKTTNIIKMCETPVEVVSVSSRLAGYQWSGPRGLMRWGVNELTGVSANVTPSSVLALPFKTCGVSQGDSSGPVFIDRNGEWLLAGILWSVSGEGPYSEHPNEPTGKGSYMNFAGLWRGNQQWPDNGVYPTTGFATAIAPRINWIIQIITL